MKKNLTVATLLLLLLNNPYYSQSRVKQKDIVMEKNHKGISLKVDQVKPIESIAKRSWSMTSTLQNNSRDTLFYFITNDCEWSNFTSYTSIDTISLYPDFERCDVIEQRVIVLPPKAERSLNLVFSSKQPVNTTLKFTVFQFLFTATNKDERIPHEELMKKTERRIVLKSNEVKLGSINADDLIKQSPNKSRLYSRHSEN